MAYARHPSLRGDIRKAADGIATGLGWFSIGLGLIELLAPHTVSRSLGRQGHERIIRLYGAREIANGIGLLTARTVPHGSGAGWAAICSMRQRFWPAESPAMPAMTTCASPSLRSSASQRST